ncbi:MAG: hypothetical protein Q7R96_02090 [Nanoarchaeota archaeon]|nr:hypothetical protein [Nanoarchaeota archaeon]
MNHFTSLINQKIRLAIPATLLTIDGIVLQEDGVITLVGWVDNPSPLLLDEASRRAGALNTSERLIQVYRDIRSAVCLAQKRLEDHLRVTVPTFYFENYEILNDRHPKYNHYKEKLAGGK